MPRDPHSINILLIEDNSTFVRMLTLILEEDSTRVWNITHSLSLKKGTEHLRQGTFDIVITDLSLPDTSRSEIVKTLREANSVVPMIVLSAYSDQKLIEEILAHGAQKFLAKEDVHLDTFAQTILNVIAEHSSV